MKFLTALIINLFIFITVNCSYLSEKPNTSIKKCKIVKSNSQYQLLLNGKPYFIKGAVAWQCFDLIKKYGGNSVRTWASPKLLDEVAEHELTCLVNLPVKAERDGMDYDDRSAVSEQFEEVIKFVKENKNHSAVMMWAVGNELDWIPPGKPYNRKVWNHLNELAIKIHEIDPHHPVLTTIGSVHKDVIWELMTGAPELDLIGLNEYGNILKLAGWIREFGWTKPYVLTEWGPSGFWQVPYLEWKVPVEETSTMKADLYKKRYEEAILKDKQMCLGSFVFLWNQHQERTHTWFSMFDSEWRETEAVDVMRYEWTGEWPPNVAPRIDSVLIDGRTAYSNIYLKKGQSCSAQIYVNDPDNDPLTYQWEVLQEGISFPYGGQGEKKPPAITGLIIDDSLSDIRFNAPTEDGPYRLFVYIYDGQNHFSTANIPFFVK